MHTCIVELIPVYGSSCFAMIRSSGNGLVENKAPSPFMIIFTGTQPAITCSKLTIETLEQGVKYGQS